MAKKHSFSAPRDGRIHKRKRKVCRQLEFLVLKVPIDAQRIPTVVNWVEIVEKRETFHLRGDGHSSPGI